MRADPWTETALWTAIPQTGPWETSAGSPWCRSLPLPWPAAFKTSWTSAVCAKLFLLEKQLLMSARGKTLSLLDYAHHRHAISHTQIHQQRAAAPSTLKLIPPGCGFYTGQRFPRRWSGTEQVWRKCWEGLERASTAKNVQLTSSAKSPDL